MSELNFIILNKLGVLVFILIFFIVIFSLNKSGKKVPIKGVTKTINLSLFGITLLLFAYELKDVPIYGKTAHLIQNLITLICVASLVKYIIVELFLNIKWKGDAPNFLKDIYTLIIYLLFAIISLRLVFNIELSSVITTSAVLTAAIAFAMQSTLANVVSGFSIQIDKNLKKGKWIYVKDKDIYGEIVNVGFRYLTLKTLENTLFIVPNNQILQSPINIYSVEKDNGNFALYATIGLRYELAPDKAKNIIKNVLENNRSILKKPEPKIYLNRYADSSIEYRIKFYINDFRYKDQILDSIYSNIWYAVIREGYDFPYPHRELIRKTLSIHKTSYELIRSYIEKCYIFQFLKEQDLEYIIKHLKEKTYGSGETIVKKGDFGDSLFIIGEGLLDVYIDDERVGELKKGDFFGEHSLLTGEKRSATVIARTESLLFEITKEIFSNIILNTPELVEKLSKIMDQREEENLAFLTEKEKKDKIVMEKTRLSYRFKRFFGLVND